MNLSNAALDRASERESQVREAAVATARARLKAEGSELCIECTRSIPAARRAVAPFATRCIECQTIHEEEKYHR